MLAEIPELRWERAQKAPALTKAHKTRRIAWAKQQLCRGAAHWKRTIFSDESRFASDGPDGLSFYWRDKRSSGRRFTTRQNGSGRVMVWAAFSWRGKSPLVFVDCSMDEPKYVEVLHDVLVPYMDELFPNGAMYQQGNAPCHTSNVAVAFFDAAGVGLLPWPARSPDANPIENLWAILSREVYKSGRQFDAIDDLKDALQMAWDRITMKQMRDLVESMTNRCINNRKQRSPHKVLRLHF